jgi:hypothetical protein
MAPSLPSGKPHNHAYGCSRRRQGLGDQGGVTEMERGAEATGFEFERRRRSGLGREGRHISWACGPGRIYDRAFCNNGLRPAASPRACQLS